MNRSLNTKIPTDIVKFLTTEGGRSLIIRGGPGTGKTTFALELTEMMRGQFNTHYVSSRVADRSLYDHFPWLRELAVTEKKSLIHGPIDDRLTSYDNAPDKVHQEEMISVNRIELDRLEARVEAGDEFLEESEFENPTPPVFEEGKLTFDIAMILPEIDLVYDVIDQNLPKKSLVMIDSIEALSEKYGISARKLIYTMQKDLVENSKTNVVFILEKTSGSDLEFLADGVVDMNISEYEGRRIRTLYIQKLRGVHIKNPSILFSLLGGRYNAFDRIARKTEEIKIRDHPIDYSPGQGQITTGITELDQMVGGVKQTSVNLFEFGDGVDTSIIKWLISRLTLNSISQKRGTYLMLPERIDFKSIVSSFEPVLEEEQRNALHLIEVAEIGGELDTGNVISIEGENIGDDFRWDSIKYHLSHTDTPYLFIAAFDTLNSIYGPNSYLDLIRHISVLRKNGGTFFGLGWSSDKDTGKFAKYAHNHIKLDSINGSQVIYGERPYTNIKYISLNESDSTEMDISLVPLV